MPQAELSEIFGNYLSGSPELNLDLSDEQIANEDPKELVRKVASEISQLKRNEEIRALLLASKCFRWLDDHKQALNCLNRIRIIMGKDYRQLPSAMTEYGYVCGEHFADLQSAVIWSDRSALLATIYDDNLSTARALIAGATFSSLQGNFLISRQKILKALRCCEESEFLQSTCFHSMAVISLKIDQVDEASSWLKKAVPLLSKNGGKNFGKALWLMGEIETRKGNLQSATRTLEKAFDALEPTSPVDSALVLIDIIRISLGHSDQVSTSNLPNRIMQCASRLPRENVIGRTALIDLAKIATRGERPNKISLAQAKRSISRSPRAKRFSG